MRWIKRGENKGGLGEKEGMIRSVKTTGNSKTIRTAHLLNSLGVALICICWVTLSCLIEGLCGGIERTTGPFRKAQTIEEERGGGGGAGRPWRFMWPFPGGGGGGVGGGGVFGVVFWLPPTGVLET